MMVRRNTYNITGFKEWSSLYWKGVFLNCDSKVLYHYKFTKICLDILTGRIESVLPGIVDQHGFDEAWKEACRIKYKNDGSSSN